MCLVFQYLAEASLRLRRTSFVKCCFVKWPESEELGRTQGHPFLEITVFQISIYIDIIHRLRYLVLIPLIGYVFQVVGRPFLSLSIISGSFMKTCLSGREELDDSILVSGVSDGVSRLEDSNFSKMLNSSHPKTCFFSSLSPRSNMIFSHFEALTYGISMISEQKRRIFSVCQLSVCLSNLFPYSPRWVSK